MVSKLKKKQNFHHNAGGGATFTVRGGRMTEYGWCPAYLSLDLGSYSSTAQITFNGIDPAVLRAVADDLEARLALLPDKQVANG